MVGRKLKQAQYGALQAMLLSEGRQRPLCPICELELRVDRVRYTLFLQPERHNQVYLLSTRCTRHKERSSRIIWFCPRFWSW